jgi:hypothetical protein
MRHASLSRWEGCSDQVRQSVDRCAGIWGRDDPEVETVSRWASENPTAMKRLLDDPILRSKIGEALVAFDLLDVPAKEKGEAG